MSRQNDDNLSMWRQTEFGDGLVKNAPHDNIPSRAVAGLINAHSYDTEIHPRLGSWLWSDLQPPAWRNDCEEEKSGYALEKSGDTVTCDEEIFSEPLVSCYIAWPVDDGYFHDEIIEYLSATSVRTSVSGDRELTEGCYIHGRMNINRWHKRDRKKIWQWGKRIYTSPVDYSRFDECLCISRKQPSNVISDWDEMDSYSMIGNSSGIFKLSFDASTGMFWKANSPIPTVLLEGCQKRKNHRYRHDVLYSVCRLGSQGLRDRRTATLLQQSGTTRLNLETTPNRDYSTYWTEKQVGPNDSASKTGCKLTCARMSDTHKDPAYYRTITPPGASFGFTHNDITEQFIVDMSTTGTNVQSMSDVANSIQEAINNVFPFVIVEYDDNEEHFEFTTGEEKNSTIGFLTAGTSGTDISETIKGRVTDGGSIDDKWSSTSPLQVGVLYVPQDYGEYEWHWTHFTLWMTTDISANGADPRTTESGLELSPLKFTWSGDYRIAGSFYASKTDNIITAEIGTFEKADEGTPYKWEDGSVDTIVEYLTPKKVRVGSEYYDGGTKPLQAGAIGGGRVLRASQSGNIVTIESVYNDDTWSSIECDERKTIYWANGYASVIVKVLSDNTVQVHDSATRPTQGATIDPTCRVVTITTTDEDLRCRMDEKHIGLLNMRYKEPMPSCNILKIVPGFMVTSRRDSSLIYYCDLPNNAKYNAGYHLLNRQVIDKIEGSIQIIRKTSNYLLVWCANSLWSIPTNNPDIKELPEFGEWYGILHADIVDEYTGAVDWGGIEEIEQGAFELVCQDQSVRQLVNRQYSEDFTYNSLEHDIVATDMKGCWNLGASVYGRTLGHVFWRTRKS